MLILKIAIHRLQHLECRRAFDVVGPELVVLSSLVLGALHYILSDLAKINVITDIETARMIQVSYSLKIWVQYQNLFALMLCANYLTFHSNCEIRYSRSYCYYLSLLYLCRRG